MSSVGGGAGGGGSNHGRIMVQLKPRAQRDADRAADRAAARGRSCCASRLPRRSSTCRPRSASAAAWPTAATTSRCRARTPTSSTSGRRSCRAAIDAQRARAFRTSPPICRSKSPRVNLVIDRDKAAAARPERDHRSQNALYDALRPAAGPPPSTRHQPVPRAARARSEVPGAHRLADEDLLQDAERRAGAAATRWSNFKETAGPQSITHSGQLPSVTVSFTLKPGVSLGAATDEIKTAAERLLPADHHRQLPGHGQGVPGVACSNLGLLLIVAIARGLHRARRAVRELHPPADDSLGPALGRLRRAADAVSCSRIELNIYSFVGLIMLIGIVKKNAIMQIDFALEAERKDGKSPTEAIYEGCLIRFRPIMMTTMAALLGAPADRARLRRRRRSAQAARPGGGRRPGGFAVDDSCI